MTRCVGDRSSSASAGGRAGDGELPLDPFEALRVTYGMLLGVEDFRVLAGYPRGKHLLHQSWLHGAGVVWGYQVAAEDSGEGHELRVGPGLAVDGLGQELPLHAPWCQDVQAWLDREIEQKVDLDYGLVDGHLQLVATLTAASRTCLTRPVPALADPCDVSRRITDESRVVEGTALTLTPRASGWTPAAVPGFHRVRALFGLDPVADGDEPGREASEELSAIERCQAAERPPALLAAFRRLAARDVKDLSPPRDPGDSAFPCVEEDPEVLLAKVVLDLDEAGRRVHSVTADTGVQSLVLPTTLLQELLCGIAPLVVGEGARPDAGGPRLIRDSVHWTDDRTLEFCLTRRANHGSLRHRAVHVSSLGADGWVVEDIAGIDYDGESTIILRLHERPAHPLVRLVLRGTGPTPVTGHHGVPLAGLDDGPPGSADDGHDAVLRIGRY
jgi:hypothetical protein